MIKQNMFKVSKGQLTFDSEGQEGGPYHSRMPHVPSDSSGVTIGRGYDMRHRSASQIMRELSRAGLREGAVEYSRASGLYGQSARDYVDSVHFDHVEITEEQQRNLFELVYDWHERDVIRICNKPDVVEKYGATDWGNLHPAIKEVVVDLRFRGDYTPSSREFLQKLVVSDCYVGIADVVSNKDNWKNVPESRFKARIDFLGWAYDIEQDMCEDG